MRGAKEEGEGMKEGTAGETGRLSRLFIRTGIPGRYANHNWEADTPCAGGARRLLWADKLLLFWSPSRAYTVPPTLPFA